MDISIGNKVGLLNSIVQVKLDLRKLYQFEINKHDTLVLTVYLFWLRSLQNMVMLQTKKYRY